MITEVAFSGQFISDKKVVDERVNNDSTNHYVPLQHGVTLEIMLLI